MKELTQTIVVSCYNQVESVVVCYSVLQYLDMALVSRLLKLQVSFAKEPYKRDDILQKRL